MSASFFEKLKKGMGVEGEAEEQLEETEEIEEEKPKRKRGPKPKKAVYPPLPPREKKANSEEAVEEITPKKIGAGMPGIKKGEMGEEKVEISFATGEEPEKLSPLPQQPSTSFTEGLRLSSTESPTENKEKWPAVGGEPEGELAIDVYQTENNLIIQTAIAGIKPESLDIVMERDIITIKGIRQKPLGEEGDYFTQECFWGTFSREIILPVEVDPDRAEATMKDGILTIRIPKILREKKRIIKVRI